MASRLVSQLRSSRLLLSNQFAQINGKCFHLSSINNGPVELKFPALSPTMTEGTIIKWHKKEGDQVVPGDLLMEIQTDKAVIPYELEEEGTLAKILAEDSKIVQIGEVIGVMALPGEDWKTVSIPDQKPVDTSASSALSESAPPEAHPPRPHHHYKIGPAAKILLNLYQISPSDMTKTGPRGFVSKCDVKEYIMKNNLSPAPAPSSASVANRQTTKKAGQVASKTSNANVEYEPDFEDIELSNMRKVIAKRLVLSKTTIPHSYINTNCVIDKVIALRKQMAANNQKVSLNDFIIKAAALTLKLVPEVNSNSVDGSDQFKQSHTVDISIAVATDKGLITPIVPSSDQMSVEKISQTVKLLADKARQGKLQPHEFQGGSFSISNLGMFGITEFSAVINPPQTAILAVGKSQNTFNLEMEKQTEVSFTLSYDARCVDLDRAYKFMNTFKYLMANPDLLVEQVQTF